MFFAEGAIENARMDLAQLKQLRRENLNAKIEEMGGQAVFVNKTGMNQGQISQLQLGKKLMGEDLARAIEEKAGWPLGCLDSTEPQDPLDRIEAAINAADWVDDAFKQNFIGLIKGMRGKKE